MQVLLSGPLILIVFSISNISIHNFFINPAVFIFVVVPTFTLVELR